MTEAPVTNNSSATISTLTNCSLVFSQCLVTVTKPQFEVLLKRSLENPCSTFLSSCVLIQSGNSFKVCFWSYCGWFWPGRWHQSFTTFGEYNQQVIKLIYQYSCDSHIGSRGNALDIPDILSYLKKAKKNTEWTVRKCRRPCSDWEMAFLWIYRTLIEFTIINCLQREAKITV